MSGLLALLDDVAGIAKIAAASIDDVAAQAVKAGAKAAGALIDDAAVTPKYVNGFSAAREVPIILKIARGSLFNKIIILLPIALLLSSFAPWAVAPLLMVGGAYLCFEGAEKILHAAHPAPVTQTLQVVGHEVSLEEERVRGAIKTDFILSAEIMTIALATIPEQDPWWSKAMVLLLVAVAITVAVYGFVALIVKADDLGLHLARRGQGALAATGRWIVRVMPTFMRVLNIVGTAAMIWVGGNIVIHGLHELGLHQPYLWIHHMAESAAHQVQGAAGLVNWAVMAFFDGILGLIFGLAVALAVGAIQRARTGHTH